jgi:hypothetical protein
LLSVRRKSGSGFESAADCGAIIICATFTDAAIIIAPKVYGGRGRKGLELMGVGLGRVCMSEGGRCQ